MEPMSRAALQVLNWLSKGSERMGEIKNKINQIIGITIAAAAGLLLLPFLMLSMLFDDVSTNQPLYESAVRQVNEQTGLRVRWQEAMAIDQLRFPKEHVLTDLNAFASVSKFIASDSLDANNEGNQSSARSAAQGSRLLTWEDVFQIYVKEGAFGTDPKEHLRIKEQIAFAIEALDVESYEHVVGNENWTPRISSYEWPLDLTHTYITSGYGSRFHPIKLSHQMHYGFDVDAPVGSSLYAVCDGTVETVVRMHPIAGNYVNVRCQDQTLVRYLHLSQLQVKPKDVVVKKELIGQSGNTGSSTGPHLHFEMYVDEKPVNPIRFYE